MRAQPEQVVQHAGDFGKHHTDVLRPNWHLNTQQLFDGQAVSVLVAHHGHVIQAVHVRQGLDVGLGFGQFFGGAVQQTDVRISSLDDFAVQLKDQTQHAVRGRVLRTEVQGVVLDF